MCWPYVYRNIQPKIRGMIGSVNKEKAKSLFKDIENLQWSCTSEETFSTAYNLLREKYEPLQYCKPFFEYFEMDIYRGNQKEGSS